MATPFLPEAVLFPVATPTNSRDRSLRILRVGSLIPIPLCIVWVGGGLVLDNWPIVVVNGGLLVMAVTLLRLLRDETLQVFRYVYPASAMIACAALSLTVTGPHAQWQGVTHFYLLPVSVAVFYIFNERQRWQKFGFVSAGIGLFLSLHYGGSRVEPLAPLGATLQTLADATVIVGVLTLLLLLARTFTRDVIRTEQSLASANARAEALLDEVLPVEVSARLREEGRTFADAHVDCTVLFADIVGFTSLAGSKTPGELVAFLNDLFCEMDHLAERFGVEKIKTIGDAYMAAAGVPTPSPDHAHCIAGFALALRELTEGLSGVSLRIGIHSGPVVAGVIGRKRFRYDLWGETVNVASRMESHGIEGEIQVSEVTRALLGDRFRLEPRGPVALKGCGNHNAYLLLPRGAEMGATTSR